MVVVVLCVCLCVSFPVCICQCLLKRQHSLQGNCRERVSGRWEGDVDDAGVFLSLSLSPVACPAVTVLLFITESATRHRGGQVLWTG